MLEEVVLTPLADEIRKRPNGGVTGRWIGGTSEGC